MGYRVRSLVVSDLRLEIKGSRFTSMCRGELSAVIARLISEAGENGSEELKKCPPLPLRSSDL